MPNNTLSSINSLELVPVEFVSSFTSMGAQVELETVGTPINADAIPGTITAQSSENGSVKNKQITYKRRPLCVETGTELTQLLPVLLIAIYVDEFGNRRVCGSPACPLRLSFTISSGVYNCTLTGQSRDEDPILALL